MTSFFNEDEAIIHELLSPLPSSSLYFERDSRGTILVTPSLVLKKYEVESSSATTGSSKISDDNIHLGNQSVVLLSKYDYENYRNSDVQEFFEKFAPNMKGQTCTSIYGENDETDSNYISGEANLDVQYIMSVGQFIDTTSYKITPRLSNLDKIEHIMFDYAYAVGNQVISFIILF